MSQRVWFWAVLLGVGTIWQETGLSAQDASTVDFFETRVRPILLERCASCHGAERQESDLRVDSLAALTSGGASGDPAIVLGETQAGTLLKAIRHQDGLEMPPDGRLDDGVIADLEAWVAAGAVWPASSEAAVPVTLEEKLAWQRDQHWSLQPLTATAAPAASDDRWSREPIDRWVFEGLRGVGANPSEEAPRETLLRRLKFDLLGLPVTYDEVQDFVADPRPDAYERQLDRWLASPQYGERWGRHWLDLARYADTRGYAFARDRRYPFAYTYRDYVLRAFDEDLPYDRFIKEQLAADQLDLGDESWRLSALGFLTVGRRYLTPHEDIDDRIDVVFRGLMGLTVACARCHDHKYDAVPTEDYYAVYGVFASSEEPEELPSIADADAIARNQPFFAEKQRLEQAIETYLDERFAEMLEHARNKSFDYLVAARYELPEAKDRPHPDLSFPVDDVKTQLRDRWKQWWERVRAETSPRGRLAQQLGTSDEGWDEAAVTALIAEIMPEAEKSDPALARQLAAMSPKTPEMLIQVFAAVFAESMATVDQADADAKGLGVWRREIEGDGGIAKFDRGDRGQFLNRAHRERLQQMQSEITAHLAAAPAELGRAMVLRDRAQPVTPRVFIRGNPGRPGDEVPRRFVSLIAGPEAKPFERGSGRLDLAESIVSRDNPLTSRVITNRIWMYLFAAPLVDSPSDFGVRTEAPVRQDLLDDLAYRLMEKGWSLKQLQRDILVSSTYRQASGHRSDLHEQDSDNRLLGRQNRRRAEFEALRDGMLAVADRLQLLRGGKSVDIYGERLETRRTVYANIDRQDLPNLLRTFDFASPDQHVGRRPLTIVPQQALYLMNSPFIRHCAQALAEQSSELGVPLGEDQRDQRLSWMVRRVLARDPSPEELELFRELVQGDSGWQRAAQVLLSTNEFVFVD